MPGPSNTLLIEGSFEELAEEFAHYLDEIKRKQGDTNTAIHAEISSLLEQKDEVLKKLVTGSAVLNAAPEKGSVSVLISESLSQRLTRGGCRIHCSLQSPGPPHPPILQP